MLDRCLPVGAGIVLTLVLAACGAVIQGAKARPSPTPHPCDRYTLALNDLDMLAGEAMLALNSADIPGATLALSGHVAAAYEGIPESIQNEAGTLIVMATQREFTLATFRAEQGERERTALHLRAWIGALGAAMASGGGIGCG